MSRPWFENQWFENQWFKPHITLGLAQDGVAARLPGKPASMLSSQNLTHHNYQPVFEALHQHKNVLAKQKIRLIISNHFMRYTVLPWQDGVEARQDWLALANHAFRQQFGAVADNWQVRVSLGGYGQAVIASAMDQALYDGLLECAHEINFSWQAIEPLAMRLLNQAKLPETSWLLVAEPQHLLLCEMHQGQLQRFSVASPPTGQEASFATQMIARARLQLPNQQQPSHTQVMVSGRLSEGWNKDNTEQLQLVLAKQRHQHHAGWLLSVS